MRDIAFCMLKEEAVRPNIEDRTAILILNTGLVAAMRENHTIECFTETFS